MSRIGKKPVQIPAGVTVTIDGTTVSVKGSKGDLSRTFSDLVSITLDGDVLTVARVDESKESNAQQGLVRTLINNMVVGVSEGFEKKLELTGVGYRATLKGKDLDLSLGYSHPVIFACPEHISFEVPDNTHITVKGISKEQVGQVAAEIREKRPPEPYKGKGIHYEGERIRRKLGKAAK
ncbi:MAG: 50S ribosomal protein L6 [Coriobacteriaceae bacterium]|uniref:50S ribosomal protein L6 n=1 Tax=Tractidigestivibacter sp. TaxID=2847320 RepID=UPI002A8284BB|nr:50S ribosomal protein L6 [Tractidigestivibacter sp.]MCI6273166.1 50S ribosomal protein L6 [Coriobacteriaceae bacterium]MCI6547075.1 50S ribosomal protein L6 [Coriobacteriaceae bacterium]MCI6844590.1 50S ribosomal protein L6 [Coriobacteriaceae bacterium]MCI7438804.1 50S ribosomal protein L6 [Coriobacteriaceae bacterium]MDD7584925.1 50S ribosomal protein L6 [Coriobacteriaceae bacterium]